MKAQGFINRDVTLLFFEKKNVIEFYSSKKQESNNWIVQV